MNDAKAPGFSLEAVGVRIGSADLLRQVDLELPRGAFSALVGPSGSGKSTLLRLLNRLLETSEGEVQWAGRPLSSYDVRALRQEVGMVVQQPRLSAGSAGDNLDLPVKLGLVPAGEAKARRERACELAGIERALLEREQHELSGGERQRIALARALMLRPQALLLDEPAAALDARSARRLMRALRDLQSETGVTLVMVTHRIEDAAEHCDRLAVLCDGQLVEHGETRRLLEAPRSSALRDLLDRGD